MNPARTTLSVEIWLFVPFCSPYWLKNLAEWFVIFPFSTMIDQFTSLFSVYTTSFYNNTLQNDNSHWVWHAVVSEVQKQHLKKRNRNKKVEKFKDSSRPHKEIKYFSRTLTEFKNFSRRLLQFKIFSRLYEACSEEQMWQCQVLKIRSQKTEEYSALYTTYSQKGLCIWEAFL